MRLTESAKKLWNVLSGSAKLKVLNFVWCRGCLDLKGMHPETAQVKAGNLLIRGHCMDCGEPLQMNLDWSAQGQGSQPLNRRIPRNRSL